MGYASKDPKPLSKIAIIDDTAIQKIVEKLPPINATLTPQQIADIAAQVDVSNKVDKVTGKGLSTNDYTDDEKIKVNTTGFGIDGIDGSPGPKGDPFVYSDFTTQQLLDLKGDPGVQGDTGPPGSDASVTKSNVEAVLTGELTSHSHAGAGGLSQQQIEGLL